MSEKIILLFRTSAAKLSLVDGSGQNHNTAIKDYILTGVHSRDWQGTVRANGEGGNRMNIDLKGHVGRRYIVTGAAGHLGSTILRLLADSGDETVGLILPSETPVIEAENIHYVRGDLREIDTLRPLFAGGDGNAVVIHTAGLISIAEECPPQMWAVNVEGTKNMLRLSREMGVDRFVYVSSVHAIPEMPKPQVIREVDAFSPEWVTGGYAKTKAAAAQAVLDAAKSGFPAIIIHPSGILGPYDRGRNHLLQLVTDFIDGRLPVCVKGGYNFVDVRDVAAGCLRAAEAGAPGNCYILAGQYLTVRELLVEVGRLCGRKQPITVPWHLAWMAAPVVECHARRRGTRPLYTRYALSTLKSNGNFSFEKARTALGYQPRDMKQTIQDMTHWLLENRVSRPTYPINCKMRGELNEKIAEMRH